MTRSMTDAPQNRRPGARRGPGQAGIIAPLADLHATLSRARGIAPHA
jgi:hypothetical protein